MENKKREKRKLINRVFHHEYFKSLLMYTAFFSVIALFLISIFKQYNKGFIWNEIDGLEQHVTNLRYFRSLLVEFIKTGNFSTFTWNIGLGFDMFSNLAYYILGDIFSYSAILVPTSKIEILYSILVIVRMYFIGITFLCYCRYKKMNAFSATIGALMYTFCTFVLYVAVRHPYFVNAVIIFPLVMIGIEKMILENKPIFYTVIIGITFTMNFYFAYMIAVIIAIYGITLAIYTYKKEGIKKIAKVLLKTLLYSILGIMLSAIVLLPTAIAFLNCERATTDTIYPYSITYYRNLMNNLLTISGNGYWVYLGVQSIVLISLPVFIRKRKDNYPMFILLLILILPLLVSQIGSMFCGFAYPNNRWVFVLSFIFSFITTKLINDNAKTEKADLKAIGILVLLYLGLNIIFEIRLKFYTQIQIFIFVIILILMLNKEKIRAKIKKINLYYVLLIIVFSVGIVSSVKYLYGVEGEGYASEFLENGELNTAISTSNNQIENFGKTIDYLNQNDKSFYKVSKYPYAFDNVSLLKQYKAIGHYYSITPSQYGELSVDLRNAQYYLSHGLKEFDYRTKINTLLGVKYHISNKKDSAPYGYSMIKEYKGKTYIYQNNYELPFGVLYTNYITEEEYDNLTPLEKESSLLKTTAINTEDLKYSNLKHNNNIDYTNTIKELDYRIVDNNKIMTQNDIKITKAKKNSIKLNIDKVKNSEIYICIEGLDYKAFTNEELMSVKTDDKSSTFNIKSTEYEYKWRQPSYAYDFQVKFGNVSKIRLIKNYVTSPYYMEVPEFLFNLGYYDEASGEITITFSKIGNYSYDSIKVYAVSMEDYEEDINNLRKSNFEVTDYNNGYLNGKVNTEESGILQFSTMYNKGWTVYVDNEKVDTLVANKYFLGIEIEKGEHTVSLQYSNPYIKYGFAVTVLGSLIFVFVIVINIRKRKKEN